MIINIMSYIAMSLSISGNYFVNRKNVLGMWLWFFGSLIWLCLSIYSFNIAQLIMFLIYTYFNIDGIIKWKNKKA